MRTKVLITKPKPAHIFLHKSFISEIAKSEY